MTGIGTLLHDDPQLTVRHVATSRQPVRIVVDRHLELPLSARILEGGNVLVATGVDNTERARILAQTGAEILVLPNADGKVDLPALLQELGRREMNEILVESGNRLNGALLRAGVVDELLLYFAPQLLGDVSRGMFDVGELTSLDQRVDLSVREVRRVGDDLRIVTRVKT
jgi:diaminohydroxyphosphoribosylaminopyrimidine deaminase/5-amino-6-(5-phosphoribosylamino)uracil reductase